MSQSPLMSLLVQHLEKYPLPNGLGGVWDNQEHCSIPTLASNNLRRFRCF